MIGIILLIGFLFRLIISHWGTYWGDMNSWIGWSNRLMVVGFKGFYQSWCDYLPGYLYVLWLLGKIRLLFSFLKINIPNELLFKLPSILADLGTTYLIFKLVNKFKTKNLAYLAALVYLFNPAIWVNSSLWGQADSFFAFLLLLAFYLLIEEKFFLSAAIFGISAIVKPLSFFLLPLIIAFLLIKKRIRILYFYLLVSLIFIIFPFIPFADKNIFSFIIERFKVTLNQYSYTSLNAFNFWGLVLPFWTKDGLTFFTLNYQKWGIVIFSLFYLVILVNMIKKRKLYLFLSSAGLVLFSSFLFLTRIHERHLLPIFSFLILAAVFNPFFWIGYAVSSLIYVLNLRYAFVLLTAEFKTIFSPLIIYLLCLLQLMTFIFLIVVNKLNLLKKKTKQVKFRLDLFPKNYLEKEIKINNSKRYLALILLFAFIIRLFNIEHPKAYIFDEVYHGFTAQEMAKGNIMAWEWWNNPPKGFAYEWTHPALAKLIMAGGILLIGKNDQGSQYAFRFPAVLFSLGVIFLIYLLSKELFKNERIGLWAAFLFSFDGLGFVMGRIGMADIYFLFFLLLTIYLLLKEKYFWSAMSLGLAISTKWTGMYLYPVVGLIFLFSKFLKDPVLRKDRVFTSLIIFILIPSFIYLLSYLPFFTSGHNWNQFIELQKQMWVYHTNLKATHDYQSPAWTWPFLIRPVWFWVDYQQNSIANIYNLGNPLLWWSGLMILPLLIYQAIENMIKKKNFSLGLIIFCYFAFWLPWLFSPRIMFLHHYLPAIPFMCILLAYFLNKVWEIKSKKKFSIFSVSWRISNYQLLTISYQLLIVLCFFFFYPIYTGLAVPKDLVRFFFWLPSWR